MSQDKYGTTPVWTTEHEVAIIGQETWEIDKGERASAVAALRRGFDRGMTHMDTAEMYGDSEEPSIRISAASGFSKPHAS